MRILLVEDKKETRYVVTKILGQEFEDIIFIEAEDGKEGLEKFATLEFDTIITDLYMPEGEGLDFIGEVRKLNTHIPIIVYTGMEDTGHLAESYRKGATYFLRKSRGFNELTEAIRKIKGDYF